MVILIIYFLIQMDLKTNVLIVYANICLLNVLHLLHLSFFFSLVTVTTIYTQYKKQKKK